MVIIYLQLPNSVGQFQDMGRLGLTHFVNQRIQQMNKEYYKNLTKLLIPSPGLSSVSVSILPDYDVGFRNSQQHFLTGEGNPDFFAKHKTPSRVNCCLYLYFPSNYHPVTYMKSRILSRNNFKHLVLCTCSPWDHFFSISCIISCIIIHKTSQVVPIQKLIKELFKQMLSLLPLYKLP